MEIRTDPANHGPVFTLLMVLVLVATGISLLHLPVAINNSVVLGIAFVMAGLVAAQYMGLRLEGKLVHWIVVVPTVLFLILVVMLLPDIAHVPLTFLGKF